MASEVTAPLFDPAIDIIGSEEGWIVGSDGYILHYQGGTWQPANSPTDNDLRCIVMVSADEGWAVGRNGTILHYLDGVWSLESEVD